MKSAHIKPSSLNPVFTASIAAWTVLFGQPGAAQTPSLGFVSHGGANLARQVDACVESAMSAYDIPGLATAVVANGEIAYERGYGVKHRIRGGAVDEDTLFRHGSVGKMFTAAAILRLVDHGLVGLSDPVTEYVPELHFAPGIWSADHMRVRHLIANTAAIPSYRSSPEGSLSEWVSTLDEVPLLANPGAFWNYSNSNSALADLVVERASGMASNDYLAAEIYGPAGMRNSTRYPSEARASQNYSYGYTDDGQIYSPDDYVEMVDGFTSAHDLARWAQIMLKGGEEILSHRSASLAQTPRVPLLHYAGHPSGIGGGSYGFGLFVEDYPDGRVVRHGGGIPGWVAQVAWVPSRDFAVAMLANSWPAASNGLQEAVACICDVVIEFTTPDMSDPSDPSTWSPYAGTYDAIFEDGFEFEILVEYEDGALLMTAPHPNNPGQRITRILENIHASTFWFRPNQNSWWEVTFIRGPGRPSPVRWVRNGRFVGLRRPDVRRADSRRMQ